MPRTRSTISALFLDVIEVGKPSRCLGFVGVHDWPEHGRPGSPKCALGKPSRLSSGYSAYPLCSHRPVASDHSVIADGKLGSRDGVSPDAFTAGRAAPSAVAHVPAIGDLRSIDICSCLPSDWDLAEVCLARDLGATQPKHARHMTALAMVAAVVAALGVGYLFGRRSRAQSRGAWTGWERRTSRVALGRLAVTLAALVAARRIRRMITTERMLALAVNTWGTKLVGRQRLLRRRPRRRLRWT
jgi:hypothetical protein